MHVPLAPCPVLTYTKATHMLHYSLQRKRAGMSKPVKDFFISYTSVDRLWAEWIAWCLEQAGYSIIIQAWDFAVGSNFVYEMDQALKEAQRVVAVLSPAYINSEYGFTEWAEAFRRDPQGKERRLLPVRVQPCEIAGLL